MAAEIIGDAGQQRRNTPKRDEDHRCGSFSAGPRLRGKTMRFLISRNDIPGRLFKLVPSGVGSGGSVRIASLCQLATSSAKLEALGMGNFHETWNRFRRSRPAEWFRINPRTPIWNNTKVPSKNRGRAWLLLRRQSSIVVQILAIAAGWIVWKEFAVAAWAIEGISKLLEQSRAINQSTWLIAGLLTLLVALWKIPVWQVASSKNLTQDKQFEHENEARKTLAQILAGLVVIAGLFSSIQTLSLSREGQLTDRFSKAIDQLGSVDDKGRAKMDVRLGGIYALERISRDSARDYEVVLQVLSAYVREHSPRFDQGRVQSKLDESPDIRAIITVIRRREEKTFSPEEKLDFLDFQLSDLRGADFSRARLSQAYMAYADLSNASFYRADLRGAILTKCDLPNADFEEANADGIYLNLANLKWARFRGADLRGAWFNSATLHYADWESANIQGAHVRGADLREASNLTQEQIATAEGDRTTWLPKTLRRPDNWPR